MSNFKKKNILVLSSLSSFRSGLCTKNSKILTHPRWRGGEFEERRRGGGEERITREGEVTCGGYEERRGGVEEGGGMEPRGVEERRRGEEGKMSKGGEEEIS